MRMGLHTGSCSARDGDHYGRAVNKAARVEQSAYGGQVLLSDTTASLVRDDLDEGLSLVYVGEHYFDGIIDPERLYQLSVSGLDNQHPPLRTRDIGSRAAAPRAQRSRRASRRDAAARAGARPQPGGVARGAARGGQEPVGSSSRHGGGPGA